MFGHRNMFIFFFLFSFINSKIAYVQTFTSFEEFNRFIYTAVAQATPKQPDEELIINLVQLDAQMRLLSCQTDIHASLTQPGLSTPSNTVILKCYDSAPWEIYVPVQIKLMTNMVSTSRQISPGDVLSDADLIVQKGDKFQMYGDYFYNIEQVVGLIASRQIPEGAMLSKRNVKKALMIQRNQNVSLILKHGPIEISMAGIAKSDGYLNDVIKVINPASKKMVDARVVAPDSVQVEY